MGQARVSLNKYETTPPCEQGTVTPIGLLAFLSHSNAVEKEMFYNFFARKVICMAVVEIVRITLAGFKLSSFTDFANM